MKEMEETALVDNPTVGIPASLIRFAPSTELDNIMQKKKLSQKYSGRKIWQ